MKSGNLQALREGRTRPLTRASTTQPIKPKQTNKNSSSAGRRQSLVKAVERPQNRRDPSTNHARNSGTAPTEGVPQNRRTRRKEAANAAIRVKNDSDDDETGTAFFES